MKVLHLNKWIRTQNKIISKLTEVEDTKGGNNNYDYFSTVRIEKRVKGKTCRDIGALTGIQILSCILPPMSTMYVQMNFFLVTFYVWLSFDIWNRLGDKKN